MRNNLDYFSSERFIHDDLAARAEALVAEVCDAWRKTQRLEDYAVTWPSTEVKTDDGGEVDQAVLCRLPPGLEPARRNEVLRKMVERTKAYGIVLVEKKSDAIRVLFETHHGARAWLLPLRRHGDVIVCGAPETQTDGDCIGLLWSPHRGVS